jgi:hypothetical protein
MFHNHTGLILTPKSCETLTGALIWLRGEVGAVSCTVEGIEGRPSVGPSLTFNVLLDRNGLARRA